MKNISIATTRFWLRRLPLGSAAFAAPMAHARDGSYDTSWAGAAQGRLQVDVTSPGSDRGNTLMIQPDGKLLLAGTCGAAGACATRLLPTGSYDTGFGPNASGRVFLYQGSNFQLYGAALTPDGGSVLAGTDFVGSRAIGVLIKLSATGEFVRQFNVDFSFLPVPLSYEIKAVAVQADGKIIVAGDVFGADRDFAISRVLADLSDYDSGFGTVPNLATTAVAFPGGGDDEAQAVAVQPDGKIVVAGIANFRVGVARLLANGQLDDDPVLGFGDGGRATFAWGSPSIAAANAIRVDRDGSLLIAGYAANATAQFPSFDFFVDRLTPLGRQDPDFGLLCPPPFCDPGPAYIAFDLGGLNDDEASSLAMQSDGKILVSGYATRIDDVRYFAVARLTRYGDPDPSFGSSGQTYGRYGPAADNDDTALAIAIGNGGIMIAGASKEAYVTDYRFGIAKLQLDLIFTNGMQ